MTFVLQLIVSGLAAGSLYALVALALVLIFQTTDVINFAQGEMAMLCVFFALWLYTGLGPFGLTQVFGQPLGGIRTWDAVRALPAPVGELAGWVLLFALTIAFAFALGALTERLVVRWVEEAPLLSVVIVTLGLFLIFNSLAGFAWGFEVKPFPKIVGGSPVPLPGGLVIDPLSLLNLGVGAVVMVGLWLFFTRTRAGIAMRATALNRTAARLMGIRVGRMLMLGWALAAVMGALAGLLIAPQIFVQPSMMGGVLIFAFAAAVLGGLTSPVGAIVGGLALGVIQNLVGGLATSEFKESVAFLIIILVLVVRPAGLFGRVVRKKV